MASLVQLRNMFENCMKGNCEPCQFGKHGFDCLQKLIEYSYQATNEMVQRGRR